MHVKQGLEMLVATLMKEVPWEVELGLQNMGQFELAFLLAVTLFTAILVEASAAVPSMD
jgi:hypothetical protein